MCGICGMYLLAPEVALNPDLAVTAQTMLAAIGHRGTQDGIWTERGVALCSRRLPIVDLALSAQPLFSEDRNLILVGNGEIYNSDELRARLVAQGHEFSTLGDLECVLHLFEEQEEEAFSRIRGKFALALHDRLTGRLYLVRDHLGVKPLYYTRTARAFLFASEIKALRVHPDFCARLNPQALSDYLSLQFIPGPQTVFESVRSLPPASVLVFDGRTETVRRFWNLGITSDHCQATESELAARTLELLKQAVRRRLRADVPVGFLLSGGLDSSLVAALSAAESPSPITTYSIVFKEASFDESPQSRLMARHLGSRHHELVLDSGIVLDGLERAHYFLDQPFCEGSAFPLFHICELAREQVTVLLSGEGADEIFGGYETYAARLFADPYQRLPAGLRALLARLIRRLPVSDRKVSLDLKLRRFTEGAGFPPATAHFWWRSCLNDRDKHPLLHPDFLAQVRQPETAELYEQAFAALGSKDVLNRLMACDCGLHLVDDLLARADRMGMAHTLEIRVPFLDLDLVEHAFSIPSRFKLNFFGTKRILRRAVPGLLPEAIRTRPKMGLNMPYQKWFKAGPWREQLHDCLAPASLAPLGIFEPTAVQGLLDRHETGRENNAHGLWALLNLVLWLRRNRVAS